MTRLNRALLALVVGLAAVAWWVGTDGGSGDRHRLFAFDREAVRHLVVENAAGRVVFARADDEADWTIVEPERYPAHAFAVALMVAALEAIVADRPLEAGAPDPEAIARAGLDVGVARFEIAGDGMEPRRGRVGTPPEIGRRTPIVAEDRRAVCTIDSAVARLFHRSLDDYRAPSALVFDPSEWVGVRFEGDGFAVELRNPTGNRWTRIDGSGAGVDPGPAFVRGFTRTLPRLEVVAWLDASSVPEGAFAKPRRIVVSWGEEEPHRTDVLWIGGPRDAETSFARRSSGPPFAIRTADVDAVFPRAAGDAR